MIAIHTYAPCNENDNIDKPLVYNMLLSALLANVFFDGIKLYTTKKVKEIVEHIGIPYKEIITEPFDNYNYKTFSIPKLITFSLQEEPFIHLDLDTHIYNIDQKKLNDMDIFYSYPDTPVGGGTYSEVERLYNTYLTNLYKIGDKLSPELKENITLFDIPNFCVFGGTDYKLIKKSVNHCLEIYKSNMEHFDSNYYNACIIEQLLIPSVIRMLKGKKDEEHTYLFNVEDKFIVENEQDEFIKPTYPFKMNFNGKHRLIGSEQELYNMVNYDFNEIIHLNGYKNMEQILFLTKEMVVQRFKGFKYILKINELFPDKYEFEDISKRYYTTLKNNLIDWDKTYKSTIL
jgi:hypothetical protein